MGALPNRGFGRAPAVDRRRGGAGRTLPRKDSRRCPRATWDCPDARRFPRATWDGPAGQVGRSKYPWVASHISSNACSYSSGDSWPGENEEAFVCVESELIDDSVGRLTRPPVGMIVWAGSVTVYVGRVGTAPGSRAGGYVEVGVVVVVVSTAGVGRKGIEL